MQRFGGSTCSPGDQAVGEGSVDGCVFARACVCKGKDVAASWYMHLALGLKSDSFLDTGNFYGQERQMHTQSTNTQRLRSAAAPMNSLRQPRCRASTVRMLVMYAYKCTNGFLAAPIADDLGALATDSACELDVLGHDSHTLGVDRAEVGVLKEGSEIGL